jgi:hypothetical protein
MARNLVLLTLAAVVLAAPAAPDDRAEQPDLSFVYADPGMGPDPAADSPELRACWEHLADLDTAGASLPGIARLTVRQLLSTPRGRGVVSELCGLFTGSAQPPIDIGFVDRLPDCQDSSDGCFSPMGSGAGSYQVYVRTQYDDAGSESTEFVFGEYPANPECNIVIFYEWAESAMAQTLYHELLHIWFLNTKADEGRRFPTGHAEVGRCEFEEDFLESLRAHAYELALIEGNAPPLGLRMQGPTR